MSTVDWLAEMEMEDATFLEGAKFLDELTSEQLAAQFEDDFQQMYSSEGFSPYMACIDSCSNTSTISSSSVEIEVPKLGYERPTNRSIPEAASFSDLASFQNSDSKNNQQPKTKAMEATTTPKADKGGKRGGTKEHVIAERKRRAKLSQQFIALTAIVPGIKKMDKATVLDDSIKYLKHLQEKVKTLEQQNSKTTMESAIFVKKFQIHSDSDSDSSDENFTDVAHPLPQIEARISGRNVLIRIHCEKRKGILVKALEETEKLNLSVVNSSVIPFGDSTIDITLMAQMDGEFIVTVKDLVRSLRSSLILFAKSSFHNRIES